MKAEAKIGIALPEELKTTYEVREYDLFNQIVNVKDGTMNASYTYLPDGLRMSKNVNGNDKISKWAKEGIFFLTAIGVLNGYDDMEFKPLRNVTKEEAILTILKIYNRCK